MRTPSPAEIIQAVHHATGDFTMETLTRNDKGMAEVGRQVWGYLVRRWTPHSWPELRRFCGRPEKRMSLWANRKHWTGWEWQIIDRANQWLLGRYRMPTGLERGVRLK